MTELEREYGDGLYELAIEQQLEEELLKETKMLLELFRQNPDFLRLLSNLSISKEERLAIIDSVTKEGVHPYLRSFLKILCERGAAMSYPGCCDVYEKRYQAAHTITRATVTTASPLNPAQREQMLKKLEAMRGGRVELEEKLDAALMGGVVLEMDGKRWDNSVLSRLENMKKVLSGRT